MIKAFVLLFLEHGFLQHGLLSFRHGEMFLKMKEGTISVSNILLSVSKCLNLCKTQ